MNVPYDAAGHKGPAYAYRRYSRRAGLESFAEYRRAGAPATSCGRSGRCASRCPASRPGPSPCRSATRQGTNDPRIPPFLSGFLGRQFRAVFLTWPPDYSTPDDDHAQLPRIEIHRTRGTTRLYRWLRDRIPQRRTGPLRTTGRIRR